MQEIPKIYQGLDLVRKRPGMYIGDPDQSGLNNCVMELVANSLEEHLAGRGAMITVTIHGDGSLSVADEGGGISVATVPEHSLHFLQLALTTLCVSPSPMSKPYRVLGLCGVGTKCVNALSEWMQVNTVWEGHEYHMAFSRGQVTKALTRIGEPKLARGSIIRFKPDSEIFKTLEFDRNFLAARLNHLAVLHPGLSIVLADERPNAANRPLAALYHYPNGIADFLRITDLGRYREPAEPLIVEGDINGIKVALGFQFTEMEIFSLLSFVNSSPTIDGGTHVRGFLKGLADGLNTLPDSDSRLTPADLDHGLMAVISVWLRTPYYCGATKDELANTEVEMAVRDLVSRGVKKWALQAGDHAKWLVESLVEHRQPKEDEE